MAKYNRITDEQLIQRLRAGEKDIMDYLMEKYKNLVRKEANAMYLLGGENDDLIQEGMIGLFKAVQDYDLGKEASFYSFAKLCISRQMYSAIESSKRKKHSPLNSYVSLYERDENERKEKKQPLIELLRTQKDNNPEELFLDKEYFAMMEQELKERLSDLESRVLHLHLMGEDYRSIARLLDKNPKSIDNALQRIKQKMTVILE